MVILFSPSEGKNRPAGSDSKSISALFYDDLKDIVAAYQNALKTGEESSIKKILGAKEINLDELEACAHLNRHLRAIELYSGVAYKALDYATLSADARAFVDAHTLIFSNLFGAVRPGDILPYYNLHQNAGSGAFALPKIYSKIAPKLNEMLKDKIVLDLRAGVYKKAAKIASMRELISVEFVKNNKVVSHYAKFYRGRYLRELALLKSKPSNLNDLLSINFTNLRLVDSSNFSITYEIKE